MDPSSLVCTCGVAWRGVAWRVCLVLVDFAFVLFCFVLDFLIYQLTWVGLHMAAGQVVPFFFFFFVPFFPPCCLSRRAGVRTKPGGESERASGESLPHHPP